MDLRGVVIHLETECPRIEATHRIDEAIGCDHPVTLSRNEVHSGGQQILLSVQSSHGRALAEARLITHAAETGRDRTEQGPGGGDLRASRFQTSRGGTYGGADLI